MARSLGRNVTLAAAFEAVKGTPETTGFKRLPFVSLDFGASRGLLESDQLDVGRVPAAHDQEGLDVSGTVTVPIDLRNFGRWLRLVLGNPVSSDETTHHQHIFTGAGAALPSMTVETGHPDASLFFAEAGVMANELTIEFQPRGWANASIGLLGLSSVKSGTGKTLAAADAIDRFIHHVGSIEVDDGQIANVVSGRLTYANNLEGLEGVGDAGQLEAIDIGKAALTGQIRARLADASLIDRAINSTAAKLDFILSKGATEQLTIVATKVKFSRPRPSVQGPGGVEVDFDFMAEVPDAGDFMTATLLNDVVSY